MDVRGAGMKILVPDRFNVIRILREDGESKTFLASDSLLDRTDVLVKIVRKGHFYYVREHLPISELLSADNLIVLKTLTSVMDFLQSNRRVHGAIKPSNI